MAAATTTATAAEEEARLLRLEEQAEHGGGGAWEYLSLARRLRARRPAPVLRLGLALHNDASARSRLAAEQWTHYEQVAVAAMDCQRLDVAKDCIGVLSKQFPGSVRVSKLSSKGILEGRFRSVVRSRLLDFLHRHGQYPYAYKSPNSPAEGTEQQSNFRRHNKNSSHTNELSNHARRAKATKFKETLCNPSCAKIRLSELWQDM